MEKERRPVLRTILYAVLILAGILVYAYGWQVTDINLKTPREPQRQQQVVRALRGLFSPDLFERDEQSQIAYAQINVPCTGTPPDPPAHTPGAPYIKLSPTCGQPRDQITIEGYDFRPYTTGYVRWTPPGGGTRSLGKIRTDGQGHFQNQLRIPSVDASETPHVVEMEAIWSVGWPRPSAALQITAERMIETIFLALMATTLAIFIAIPISFVAAYNLMRSVQTPLGGLLAALLPFPVGWILGRQLFGSPAALGRDLGGMGWLGLLPLLGGLALLYLLVVQVVPRLRRFENRWLAGAVRYVRMVLLVLIGLFIAGTVSGLGVQLSQALSGFLAGVLSSVIGTLADLLGILLPVLAGLGGAWVLGSIAGTLLDALLDRVDNALLQRSLGLVLGAGTGALLVFGVYRGVFHFYNPGEPVPYLLGATIGSAVLAGLLGLLARADYALPIGMIVYYIARTILNALRSVEPLIMAIVFVIWVGIGPFAGVLALTLHSIAALSKLYSEQVESIDTGPLEAIQATGATRLQTIIYGVVPQIVPPYLAFTLYRWDINVRMSTIIGFVGGGGIGQVLKQWIDLLQYRQAGVATLAITLVVAALDYVSAQARERIT